MPRCPICEEYEGTRAQVEAHISGKEDEVHTGMVGQNLVEEIVDEPVEAGVEIEPEERAEFGSDQPPSPSVPVALVVAVVIVVAIVFFVQYRMRSVTESREAGQGGVPYGT